MKKNILFIRNIFVKLTFLIFFLFPYGTYSSNLIENDYTNVSGNKTEKSADIKSEYILGVGDVLLIEFIGISLYSQRYVIDPNGYLNLPEIDNFYAENKTLEEIKKELKSIYQDYIYNPNFIISIVFFRPVNIYISGEVNKPGLYQIPYKLDDVDSATTVTPKLFDALKLVNGITNYADVTNVEISQKFSIGVDLRIKKIGDFSAFNV